MKYYLHKYNNRKLNIKTSADREQTNQNDTEFNTNDNNKQHIDCKILDSIKDNDNKDVMYHQKRANKKDN